MRFSVPYRFHLCERRIGSHRSMSIVYVKLVGNSSGSNELVAAVTLHYRRNTRLFGIFFFYFSVFRMLFNVGLNYHELCQLQTNSSSWSCNCVRRAQAQIRKYTLTAFIYSFRWRSTFVEMGRASVRARAFSTSKETWNCVTLNCGCRRIACSFSIVLFFIRLAVVSTLSAVN